MSKRTEISEILWVALSILAIILFVSGCSGGGSDISSPFENPSGSAERSTSSNYDVSGNDPASNNNKDISTPEQYSPIDYKGILNSSSETSTSRGAYLYKGVNFEGQCVSACRNFYCKVFDITLPCITSGNNGAYLYWNVHKPSENDMIRIPKDGDNLPQEDDMLVFAPWSGNPYGHVAVVKSAADRGNIVVVDSNWVAYLSGGEHRLSESTFNNLVYGWYRPRSKQPDKEWSCQWIEQNGNPTLKAGESSNFNVKFKNLGSKTWEKSSVKLGTSNPCDRTPIFNRGDGWLSNNRVSLKEDSVRPGETGTFSFWMSVPDNTPVGTYKEYFRPVVEGITWMEDYGVSWDVKVTESYKCKWIEQNAYPKLNPGESYNFSVKFRNTGNTIWYKTVVKLGTSHEKDRISIFERGEGWISSNRISMKEDMIRPGEIGTFSFTMKVPASTKPALYREYFQPVAEGITWLNDEGVYWDVIVLQNGGIPVIDKPDYYSCRWEGQNEYPTLYTGQSYNFTVRFKNTGKAPWKKGKVNLGTSHDKDRISPFLRQDLFNNKPSGWISNNRITLKEDAVNPGETGTFSFWMSVPFTMAPGTYKEYFQPVADEITWLNDEGVFWGITVRPSGNSSGKSYSCGWMGQNEYPALRPGGSYEFTVKFCNTGSATWEKGKVNLGTSHPCDRITQFKREDIMHGNISGWISNNRITLKENYVKPGETGTFSFWMSVPYTMAPGTYKEYFQPVADGITWLNDPGVYWDVKVTQ